MPVYINEIHLKNSLLVIYDQFKKFYTINISQSFIEMTLETILIKIKYL